MSLCRCSPKVVPVQEEPRKIHLARPGAPPTSAVIEEVPAESDKGFAEITWPMLRGLDVRTGQPSPLLELVAGTDIKLAGYMVPFDDGFEEVSEFLLVPTAGACVHTPAPPANQIVYTTMVSGHPAKVELSYSVWVLGRLEIMTSESPYGPAGFRLGAVSLRRRG